MSTKRVPKNPFLIAGYESPSYFCDREKETKALHSALQNERDVVLLSARRMGKTGLIHHLFATIPASEAYCIYVDIYRTECLKDFIECFGRAIIGQCGTPSAEIVSLSQIFSYMEQADKPVYVAIDEFQRILDYPEKNIEETLRSYIQHLRNVFFIYSGSQKHMMIEMFSSAKRAFYQSAQNMHLGAIEEDAYYTFCCSHLQNHQQNMSQEAFHFLYEILSAHTWYIQSVMNRLYMLGSPQITIETIQQVICDLLEENQFAYQNYCTLLAPNQLRVLRAIAKEGHVKEPNKQGFLVKYSLSAPSTVRSAIKVLVEKEFVQDNNGEYSIYDRFFGIWLAQ